MIDTGLQSYCGCFQARYSANFQSVIFRSGNPEDWKTVRWSLLDNGSGQGSFVNQTRVERNQPMPLNADDLIGFGCSESSSGRTGGKESFVYRFLKNASIA